MKLLSIIICFLVLATTPTLAATLSGKVVAVADGDTITVLTPDKEQVRVRLVEIDAPEKDQPYGQKSKKSLSDMVFGREVRVEWDKTDKYGRALGRIFVGDIDVNLQQVKNGAAWAYTQYLTDERIKLAESEARNAKAGLWALQADQIMPPWDWRHGTRTLAVKHTSPLAASGSKPDLTILYVLLFAGFIIIVVGVADLRRRKQGKTMQKRSRQKGHYNKRPRKHWKSRKYRWLERVVMPIIVLGLLFGWQEYKAGGFGHFKSGSSSSGFTCSGKRYCREMTSCEEARFYLNHCGATSMDGDGDGVPCEWVLCR